MKREETKTVETKQHYLLGSVKNALRLLQSFTLDTPEKKVTELASSLGLGKSTVSRLLTTLESEGFVMKDPESKRYKLGLSVLQLNTIVNSTLEINRESQPILERLTEETGETSHIAVRDNFSVVYINRKESPCPVEILSYIGRQNPMHCTSSGKVLLAFDNDGLLDRYLTQGLDSRTNQTITDEKKLKDTLEAVKENGFDISHGEFIDGVTSISAPIRNYLGQVMYAVSVVGPTKRMKTSQTTIVHKVKQAACEISEKLGYWKRP
ncbi:IclR family transcriptional regulator [Bacillus swezeyi]|uniref:Glycerol operon regulatory protein n=1 Tax=Bacillus swezeyi TaxID=1925020 RepID=A0A5M8RUY6_9BACI|nr:IclR family transcriptional regulator [Bacillus swezeyi]KAA6451073.1 IclR family transcriptional regulator [Bacillus swezeyi]KAA6474796.1 IclR family transcriptional regulator [Bacillus swezeyi]TYS37546.1 IclR family transcriptional regulator [Bacillus swezeyi]